MRQYIRLKYISVYLLNYTRAPHPSFRLWYVYKSTSEKNNHSLPKRDVLKSFDLPLTMNYCLHG